VPSAKSVESRWEVCDDALTVYRGVRSAPSVLGRVLHGEQVRLRAFVKSVGDLALADVTPEAVRGYIDGKGPVTQSWFCRFHTVAGFYRFAMARQYTDHSPLPPRPPKPPAEFIPYIYSEQDVRALLDAVDARYEEDWLVRPQTVRTLLLLLYATGPVSVRRWP
jgi:site-specific recombinase XerD